MAAGDLANLTDWKQSLKEVSPNFHYEPREYSGLDPVLVKAKKQVRAMTQSGYAVGWMCTVKAPAPLFPDALLAPIEITIEPVESDGIELKTTWSYVMAIDDDYVIPYAAAAAWPASFETL